MILSSSYTLGTRIALHYIIDEQMNPEMLTAEVKTIKEACGETVSISTHFVETDSADWESVVEIYSFNASLYASGTGKIGVHVLRRLFMCYTQETIYR